MAIITAERLMGVVVTVTIAKPKTSADNKIWTYRTIGAALAQAQDSVFEAIDVAAARYQQLGLIVLSAVN